MPGIIDCIPLDARTITKARSRSLRVRTEDVMNPTDVDLYRELAGGVTTLNIAWLCDSDRRSKPVVEDKYGRRERVSVPERCRGSSLRSVKRETSSTPNQPASRALSKHGRVLKNGSRCVQRARDYKRTWDEYRAAAKTIRI